MCRLSGTFGLPTIACIFWVADPLGSTQHWIYAFGVLELIDVSRMKTIAALVSLLLIVTTATGCAARRAEARAKLPPADTVCLQTIGVSEPERGLLQRKIKAHLADEGFRLVETGCDVELSYTALDQSKWEMINTAFGGRTKSSYRAEGVLTLKARNGSVVIEDEEINLRDYGSRVELIEGLAWEIARPVPQYFRSPTH